MYVLNPASCGLPNTENGPPKSVMQPNFTAPPPPPAALVAAPPPAALVRAAPPAAVVAAALVADPPVVAVVAAADVAPPELPELSLPHAAIVSTPAASPHPMRVRTRRFMLPSPPFPELLMT